MLSAALTDGSIFPEPNDDPTEVRRLLCANAYWVTGACKELNSLDSLRIVALVPRSAEQIARFGQVLAPLLKC
jgi:hypothetical protein